MNFSLKLLEQDYNFSYYLVQSFQKQQIIGALLRCADAGMAREVIVVGRRGWDEKSTISDEYCVPYKHMMRDAIAYLKSNGMSIVAIEKNDRSISLFD